MMYLLPNNSPGRNRTSRQCKVDIQYQLFVPFRCLMVPENNNPVKRPDMTDFNCMGLSPVGSGTMSDQLC